MDHYRLPSLQPTQLHDDKLCAPHGVVCQRWGPAHAGIPVSCTVSGVSGVFVENPIGCEVALTGLLLLLLVLRRYGASFGPTNTRSIMVTYGTLVQTVDRYTATSCYTMSDTAMGCTSAAGVGAPLFWKVFVGGQGSGVYVPTNSSTSGYGPPLISAVSPSRGPTSGFNITISGDNFGGPSDSISIVIGIGVQCAVWLHDHTTLRCTVPPGTPAGNLTVVVTVAGQSNNPPPRLQVPV